MLLKKGFTLKTAYSNFLYEQKNSYLMLSNIHSLPVVSEKGKNLIDGKINFQFDLIKNFIIFGTLLHTQHLIKKKKLKLHNYGTKIKYEDECSRSNINLLWTI